MERNNIYSIYIKDLEKENKILLICLLIITIIFCIWLSVAFKERNKLEKKNAKIEQQVIDYRWQLEQIEYIIQCRGNE